MLFLGFQCSTLLDKCGDDIEWQMRKLDHTGLWICKYIRSRAHQRAPRGTSVVDYTKTMTKKEMFIAVTAKINCYLIASQMPKQLHAGSVRTI